MKNIETRLRSGLFFGKCLLSVADLSASSPSNSKGQVQISRAIKIQIVAAVTGNSEKKNAGLTSQNDN